MKWICCHELWEALTRHMFGVEFAIDKNGIWPYYVDRRGRYIGAMLYCPFCRIADALELLRDAGGRGMDWLSAVSSKKHDTGAEGPACTN